MSYVAESAYRYSVYKGRIIVMHGSVIQGGRDTTWFVPDDSHRRRAPETEGEVMNCAVWLSEDDLERAKRILFEHMSKQYEMHLKRAKDCFDNMQILKEVLR